MNINDAFSSDYIKHGDLRGQPHVLTMSRIEIKEFDDGDKPCLHFSNSKKPLLLNKTNSNIIADIFGPETNGWMGQQIELYPAKTEFKGQMTDCIRVRAVMRGSDLSQPQQPAPSPAIAPDPEPAGEPEDPFGNGPMGEQGGEDLPF
jgi:hypothetical protein